MEEINKTREELISELEKTRLELAIVKLAFFKSEEKYSKAFQNSPYAITITRAEDGKFVEVNEAFIKLTGYAWDDAVKGPLGSLDLWVSPDDRQKFMNTLREKDIVSGMECLFRKKDGGILVTLVFSQLISLDNKLYILSSFNNITERKAMEEDLRAREEKYRRIFETIQDVYYEATMEGIILEVSPSIFSLTKGQITREELIGKSLVQFYSNPQARNQFFNELFKSGIVTDYELSMLNKDGSVVPVSISSKLILDAQEKPSRIAGTIRDITDRKHNENALRESEALHRAILNASPDDITITDLDGKVILVSDAAVKMFGLGSKEDAIGHSLLEFIVPEDRERGVGNLSRLMTTGNSTPEKYSGLRLDGTTIEIEVNGEFVRNEEGAPTNLVFVVRDISERVEAETALNIAQEIGKMGSWEHNFLTGELLVSDNYYRLLGLEAGANKDHLYEYFFNMVHPDDKKLVLEHQTGTYQPGVPKKINLRILLPDGSIRWVQSNVVPVFKQEKLVGLKGVNIDVTDVVWTEEYIKKQHERLSTIISTMPDLIFVLDHEGRYLEAYCSTPEMLAVPADQIIGSRVIDVFQPADAALHLEKIDQCIAEKRLITYEYVFISSSVPGNFEARLSPFGENQVLVLIRDITEKKQKESEIKELNSMLEFKINQRTEQLAEINDKLLNEIEKRKLFEIGIIEAKQSAEKANREKSEFLSRMSHELRTPMNAILGYAQLMNMSELPTGLKKGANHILSSGRHLLELINEVLDISGIEAGRLTLNFEPLKLQETIHDVVELIAPLARRGEIKVEVLPFPEKQLEVWTDKQRLNQVFINLLSNAIKYNKLNGTVLIKSERVSSGENREGYAKISFIDSGIGIAAQDIPKLFNPFVRLGNGNAFTEGTGLGLTVVKKLINEMKGRIGVESELGRGTTFWIEIPLLDNPIDKTLIVNEP
ncbi:MAG: PAS domain S-box protein, partial [Bacteroidota bacterium]